MEPGQIGLVMLAAFVAFVVSSSAGLGGSLVLVPALSLILGAKTGIPLAALLLGANNVWKVSLYRKTIPWRAAIGVVAMTVVGAFIGAALLTQVPESAVGIAVLVSFALAAIFEFRRRDLETVQKGYAPVLALGSGATSGFSGTSGPLKGVAIRSLRFDRMHFVGAASLVSLAGDVTKSGVFADAQLLEASSFQLAAMTIPVMALGSFLGRHITSSIGENAFAGVFWGVMAGYSVRVAMTLL